jgi:hypothetical protein
MHNNRSAMSQLGQFPHSPFACSQDGERAHDVGRQDVRSSQTGSTRTGISLARVCGLTAEEETDANSRRGQSADTGDHENMNAVDVANPSLCARLIRTHCGSSA